MILNEDRGKSEKLRNDLLRACAYGECQQAIEAVQSGASVNSRGELGLSALAYACGGRSPPRRGIFGMAHSSTPKAIDTNDRKELVEYLLHRGANLRNKDGLGSLPSHWAAQMGLTGCLAALKESGDDLMQKDAEGMCPLFRALNETDSYQENGVVDWLSRMSNFDEMSVMSDNKGRSPLHVAVINPGALDFLVKNGFELNRLDKYGRTPLHEGCEKSRASSVSILMEAGADPSIVDGKGLFAWQLGGGKAAAMLRVFYEKNQIDAVSKVAGASKTSRL